MSDYYEMEQDAAWEEYREGLIADALKEISREGISCYLFYYGDAIETRINECLKIAKDLYEKKYYGMSVVCSCTAVEVTIRYFILSPLLQGMFLNEEWADTLTKRIVSGQAARDRELLPRMLKFWEIDINKIKLSSGEHLWQVLHKNIWRARNNFVHRGDLAPKEISSKAIETATILAELAKKILRKAAGYSVDKDMWNNQKCGKSPFTQEK